MKNKIVVLAIGFIAVALVGTGIWLMDQEDDNYSEMFTFQEATDIIERLSDNKKDVEFEKWDLQKIDENLILASYSEDIVTDVYETEHSWILLDDKVVYEVEDGDLKIGEDLDHDISRKFFHNIKTSFKSSEKETIEFEVKETKSNRVPKGEKSVYTEGEEGEREIKESKTYVNGALQSSSSSNKVIKEPVDEVNLIGTYVAPTPPPPPPAEPDVMVAGDVVGSRKLTWYNVKYNRDGSIAPWANKMYGKWTFTETGCVPTSLAIALSGYDIQVRPDSIGDYLYGQKLFNTASYIGTGGKGVVSAVSNYGLNANGLTSEGAVHSALQRGNVVVAAIQSGNLDLDQVLTWLS